MPFSKGQRIVCRCQWLGVNSLPSPELEFTLHLPERGIRQRWEATGAPTQQPERQGRDVAAP